MKNYNKIFDNKGYLDTNKENNSPFKIIDGGNITMKGVSNHLIAIPYKNNIPQNQVLMKPNEEYLFDADFVVEIPIEDMKKKINKFQIGGLSLSKQLNPFYNPEYYRDMSSVQDILENEDSLSNWVNLNDNYSLQNSYTGSITTNIPGATYNPYISEKTPIGLDVEKLNLDDAERQRQSVLDRINSVKTDNLQDEGEENKMNSFNNYISDFDTNTAAHILGESFAFDSSKIDNPDERRSAKMSNIGRAVGAGGKLALGLLSSFMGGMGRQKRAQYFNEYNAKKQRDKIIGNYVMAKDGGLLKFFQEGGTIDDLTAEEALVGEVTSGIPEYANAQANAEVEDGEYLKYPNQEVQQVKGNTHNQGGEKMNLEEGTMIISDHLKLGADLAKDLKSKFGVSVTAKDTFADAIDKYTSQLGLKKLNKEQEEVFKRLKKQEDNTEDESTLNLNRDFLSGKIKEIEDNKKELEAYRSQFTDYVFSLQEQKKQKDNNDTKFELGGLVKSSKFKELCKKYDLSEEEAINVYARYKDGGYFQEGGVKKAEKGEYAFALYNDNPYIDYEHQPSNGRTYGGVELNKVLPFYERVLPTSLFEKYFSKDNEGNYSINDGVDISNFQKDYNTFVNNTASYLKSTGKYDSANIDKYMGDIKFLDRKGHPRDIDGQFGNISGTRSGFKHNIFTPEKLKELQNKNIYTYNDLVINSDEAKKIIGEEEYNKIIDDSKEFIKDNEVPINFVLGEIPNNEDNKTKQGKMDAYKSPQNYDKTFNVPYLPDQSVSPPKGVSPHLLIDRRYETVDPFRVSAEEALRSIYSSENNALRHIDNVNDAQRASAIANIIANSQEQENKVVYQTALANQQASQNIENANTQIRNRAEDLRASDLLDFERRQLTAVAKTDADYDNWLDYNRRVRLGNFNTINKYNNLNNLYNHYNLDPFGNIGLNEDDKISLGIDRILRQRLGLDDKEKTKTTKSKTNTKTKQN